MIKFIASFIALVLAIAPVYAEENSIGHISATVCTIVPISGTDGFGCMDCGDGCQVNRVIPANSLPDTPPIQTFTIIDTGE